MLNYKGLRATREHLTVSPTQVDRHIDLLIEQNLKTIQVTDRPAQADDEIVLDFTGYVDGVPFEGGHAENYALTLGSGTFIPGFEEQLLGCKIDDEPEVSVTFPVAYPVAEMAGKPAVFKCKIHEIRVRKKYDADDDFAREIGKCNSMSAFRQQLLEGMQAYADQQADQELKDRLMDQLCEKYPLEITKEQLEKALDIEMQNLETQLANQKLNLDLYCQFMNKTKAQLREDMVPSAEHNACRQRIIAEIAQQENIKADEASVANAFAALCRESNVTMEELQMYFDAQMEAALTRSVIEEKVLNLICDCAVIDTVEKSAH